MLQKNNGSYQKEINDFFDALELSPDLFPTSSALCQARSKLSSSAFIELNNTAASTFYKEGGYKTWKGYRVLAIDGSTLQLPSHATIKEEFGSHFFGPKADSERCMGRISYLYDVFNGLVLDTQLKGYASSEADLAWEHLQKISSHDIVLFDRYYPSYPLIFQLKAMGTHFCFRMKKDWWAQVRSFTENKENDKEIMMELPVKYHEWAEENNISKRVKCRLIKKKNQQGEIEVYCTSFLDKKKYKRTAIISLYKERWNIEEGYKLIKNRLEVEDFSGVKSLVIKQDFYAKTLLLTINAIMCQKIKPSKSKSTAEGQRVLNMNKTIGLSATKKLFLKLAKEQTTDQVVDFYTKIITGKFNYSRKNQKKPRNNKAKLKFSFNYKTA